MDNYRIWNICKLTVQLALIMQEILLSVCSSSVETYDAIPEYRYGVMLDVGSSSTKLRLYRWPKRASKNELPQLQDFYDKKFKPSLTVYANDLDNIPGYLQPIIDRARDVIPVNMHAETPIYAIATAGMRILNRTAATSVFNAVRNHLANSSASPFIFYPRQARISSGEEEGVFAWISLNYIKGAFADGKNSPSDFTGILEMGGGSTQITFLPEGPIYAGKFPVQVAGRIYPLYAHSYLMYGQNYISLRVNNDLIAESPELKALYNPCMLKGDQRIYRDVVFLGSGDWLKCRLILRKFLKTAADDWCYPKPCAVGRVYQPSIIGKQFYAIAGFVYSTRGLGVGPTLIPSELEEKSITYCNKTLEEAEASGISSRYASTLCMMGVYIPTLLTEAYGFQKNTRSVTASNTVGDKKIAWTMGAMLYEIERFEAASDFDGYVEPPALCPNCAGRELQDGFILFISQLCSLTVLCITFLF